MTESQSSLWRHRGFVTLWAGQTVSELGSQVSLVALPLVAVVVLKVSALGASALTVFQFLPFLLMGLPAGVIVDRVRRRRVMLWCDAGRLVVLGSIPVAAAFHALTLVQLYLVALLSGILTVLFDVAYMSLLPAVVGTAALVEGNGKLQLTVALAQIVGPGAGGALVGWLTAPIAVAADAVSYLVSVLTLIWVRVQEVVPERSPGETMRRQLSVGLRFVLRNPILRNIAGCTGTNNFFSSMITGIQMVFAVRVLGLTPGLIGLWLAAGTAGAPVGALVAGRIAARLRIGPAIAASAAFTMWSPLLLALAPRSFPMPFLIASGVIGSFGTVVYNVTQVSLRQSITPPELLGRMNASMRFLVWGTMPLGALAGGVVAGLIGIRPTLLAAAIGSTVSALWVVLPPVRTLSSADEAAAA